VTDAVPTRRDGGAPLVHRLFRFGVMLKAADAALELAAAVVLLAFRSAALDAWMLRFAAHDLPLAADGTFAPEIRAVAHAIAIDGTTFAGVYLLGHGIVKAILVAGLLREMRWAFPAAIAFLSIFVVYQTYRYAHTHSPLLLVLTAVDLFVLAVVARECRARADAARRRAPSVGRP
jgi:uncharacterized membrane protein